MIKKYSVISMLLLLILLSICLLFARQIVKPEGVYVDQTRNTDGSMNFSVRTVTYNGSYSPRNVGAIWITNSSNQFVKTLKIWAASHRSALVNWMSCSANNTSGAITGATLSNHQLHNVSWNGANASNIQVPDGNYNVNVEFAEHNATTSNPGKHKVITFSKGFTAIDLTPPNESYFTNMHLTWTPSIGTISGIVTDGQNNPISGANITAGAQVANTSSTGTYSMTITPGTYTVSCQAINFEAASQSNVVVISGQVSTVNFTLVATANTDSGQPRLSQYLKQNYPNPFSSSTKIGYYLEQKSTVSLDIINVKGQLVKRLVNGTQNSGWHEANWQADANGIKSLPSGKYVCCLKANGKTQLRKMLLIK